MIFLDTDVLVDLLRGYPPALEWLQSLEEAPALPGYAVLEAMAGCQNKRAMISLQEKLEPFLVMWASEEDGQRALETFMQAHLSHHIGILDVLIGECAVGQEATLCTFNVRHYRSVPDIKLLQPYRKRSF